MAQILKSEVDLTDDQTKLLKNTIELQNLDKQCLLILNDHLDEYEERLRQQQKTSTVDETAEQVISLLFTFPKIEV